VTGERIVVRGLVGSNTIFVRLAMKVTISASDTSTFSRRRLPADGPASRYYEGVQE